MKVLAFAVLQPGPGVCGDFPWNNHNSLVCEATNWFFWSLLLWSNKQRKARWLQTMKLLKQAQTKKKKKFDVQMKANDQKSKATVSEEKPELPSVLPCRAGQHWKKRGDTDVALFLLDWYLLDRNCRIACLLVIRFENNERDRFVLWGPKKHTTNITAYRHRCHQREQNETSFFWMWCSSVWCLYTMCVLTFTTIFLINFCECH